MNELIKLDEIITLGHTLAKSKYFSDAKEASQAVVKILAGQELGIGPIAAMTGIYIVKGKVTLSGNVMASLIKTSSKYDYQIKDHSSGGCLIEFFENGQSVGASEFTIEDAKTAKLSDGDNWKHYPKNMCFNRALSNGAKWFCPDLFNGQAVYAQEELEDGSKELGLIIENKPELLITPETTKVDNHKQVMIQTMLEDSPELAGRSPVEIAQFINEVVGHDNDAPVTAKEVIEAQK